MVSLMLSAYSYVSVDGTTTLPPPATEAEMEVLCARYQEVKGQEDSWVELEEVAPAEIEGAMFRLINGPSDGYWADREAVEAFERRCES